MKAQDIFIEAAAWLMAALIFTGAGVFIYKLFTL